MWLLKGKIDNQWVLNNHQYATIVKEVQQDIVTKRIQALQKQKQA